MKGLAINYGLQLFSNGHVGNFIIKLRKRTIKNCKIKKLNKEKDVYACGPIYYCFDEFI